MSIIKKAKFAYKGFKEKPKYIYTQEEMKQFENYIEDNFGKFMVYHELYSPDIHVDILVIPPTEDCYYYKLITEGVGAYKMNVPDVLPKGEYERTELVAYIPADCDMKDIPKKHGWVISQLKMIGRLAIEDNSWIGIGHTISHSEDGNIPLDPKVKFVSNLLVPAMNIDRKELDLKLGTKEKINFYQLVPLYKEEYLFQKENGLPALMNLFMDNQLDLVINEDRKNCCEEEKQIDKNEIEEEMEY